jgi:hypothetical protein
MLRFAYRTFVATFAFAALLVPSLASAQTTETAGGPPPPVTTPAPAAYGAPPADVAANEPDHKAMTATLNPLSFAIGRYGFDFQYLPVRHHAIVVNPFFSSVNAEFESTSTVNGVTTRTTSSQTFSGFGGELGYRFYTGDRGANGFFVGPSLLLGTYNAKGATGDGVSFSSIGFALDIGGQAVLGNGITIGGGFGMQRTSVNREFADLPLTAAVLAGGGWRPRFLLSLGYSFG